MNNIKKIGLTESEKNLICDSMNGIIHDLSCQGWKEIFIGGLIDSNEYDNLETKWGVNFEGLIEKLNDSTEIEMLYLLEEVMEFWEQDGSVYEGFGMKSPRQKIAEIQKHK